MGGATEEGGGVLYDIWGPLWEVPMSPGSFLEIAMSPVTISEKRIPCLLLNSPISLVYFRKWQYPQSMFDTFLLVFEIIQ